MLNFKAYFNNELFINQVMEDFNATHEEVTEQMNIEYNEDEHVLIVEDGIVYDIETYMIYED